MVREGKDAMNTNGRERRLHGAVVTGKSRVQ